MAAENDSHKAIEELLYVSNQGYLISVSADGWLRFWDVPNLRFMFKAMARHYTVDSLTCASLAPN
jgi:hypothetical protein